MYGPSTCETSLSLGSSNSFYDKLLHAYAAAYISYQKSENWSILTIGLETQKARPKQTDVCQV